MGGKTSDSGSSVATPYQQDSGADDQMMMGMMEMMGAMMESANAPEAPDPIAVPEVVRTEEVDWTEKMDQLNSKAKADYTLDRARKQGRLDTIHTSPLLDDEDIATTGLL